MTEWLGSGLQNRVQQFESAWYLSYSYKELSIKTDNSFFSSRLACLSFFL